VEIDPITRFINAPVHVGLCVRVWKAGRSADKNAESACVTVSVYTNLSQGNGGGYIYNDHMCAGHEHITDLQQ
jgi:hypothetical protein